MRVFFALWPDPDAVRLIADLAQQVTRERGGRATRTDSLHVTVAFIGEIAQGRLQGLRTAGHRAASATPSFTLVLDRVGGATRGGLAWLAPATLPPALTTLHEELDAELARAGFPIERRLFRPHATLARRCSHPVERRESTPVAWTVDRLALVESTPQPGGSRYETIAAWPLCVPADQSTGMV